MSFNSPEFLACAVHYGLLKGTASLEDAYVVHGKLIGNETLRQKRLAIKEPQQHIAPLEDGISSLTPAELVRVRESVSGVVPFKK
jgi:hypothetical protein